MHLEDHDTIREVLAGNTDAYAALINRYKDGLYAHCFRIVQDEDLAEDLAQETFIQAFQKLASYRPTWRFSTWLYTIGTRKAIDVYRRRKLWRLDEASLDKLVSNLPSPEREFSHHELRQAVAGLRHEYRQIISLYYWGGYSYQEISAIVGAPVGSIKGWMHRAIQQLHHALT